MIVTYRDCAGLMSVKDAYKSMLVTAPSPEEDSVVRWQNIESAPKDGTPVLACVSGFVPDVVLWDETYNKWLPLPVDGIPEDCWEYFMQGEYYPDIWMSIPEIA